MEITLSSYLAAPLLAWILAQTLKYLGQAYKASSVRDLSFLYKSGSMPSSHAAVVLSLLTVVGAKDGIDSALFGIVAVLAGIVLYDAVNVRRAVGEQGQVLLTLAKKGGVKTPFHLALGHRISEVAVGSLLGVVTAVLVLQFM